MWWYVGQDAAKADTVGALLLEALTECNGRGRAVLPGKQIRETLEMGTAAQVTSGAGKGQVGLAEVAQHGTARTHTTGQVLELETHTADSVDVGGLDQREPLGEHVGADHEDNQSPLTRFARPPPAALEQLDGTLGQGEVDHQVDARLARPVAVGLSGEEDSCGSQGGEN